MSPCRCGHPKAFHEHYTIGRHCAVCACLDYSKLGIHRAILIAGAVTGGVVALGILSSILAGQW